MSTIRSLTAKFGADLSAFNKNIQNAALALKEGFGNLDLKQTNSAIAGLNQTIRLSESEFKAATAGMKDWHSTTDGLNARIKYLNDTIENNKAKLEGLKRQYELVAAAEGEDSKKAVDLQIKINNQTAALKSNEAELQSVTNDLDNFGEGTEEASGAVDDLAGALAAAGIAATLKEITEALLACADAAATFEYGLAKIETLVDTTSVSMEGISTAVKDLSTATGQATTDLNEAVYQAISAGVDAAEAVEFVQQATELATGGFTDTTSAVDILTTAINAYGLSAEDATSISDMLITAQNEGKTTVAELASNMGAVIPIASAYGVELDNLSTAYAELTKNGVKTEMAGTYIRGMLNELGDTSSTVATTLREETGKSFAELMEAGYSLGDVLDILGDSVNGNTTEFSNLWSNTRAATGALSLFNAGADEFNSVLTEMQNSAGATSEAYATMADTSEIAQAKMTAALENLKVAIGDQLNPALNTLREAGAGAFEWATEFVQENPEILSAIYALITALAVFSSAATVMAVVTMPKVIKALKALKLALSTHPVYLIATAITALTAAIVTFIATTETSADRVKELTEAARELETVMEESEAAYQDTVASTEAAASIAETYIKRLEELEKQGLSTADAQDEYALTVDKLNAVIPDLNAIIDEQTGLIEGGADALYDQVDAWKALAIEEALTTKYEEQLTAYANAIVEADANQRKLDDAVANSGLLQDKLTAKYKEIAEAMGYTGQEAETMIEAFKGWTPEEISGAAAAAGVDITSLANDVAELEVSLDDSTQAEKEAAKAVENYNAIAAENEAAINETREALGEQTEATEEDTEAQNENNEVLEEANELIAEQSDLVSDATGQLEDAADAYWDVVDAQDYTTESAADLLLQYSNLIGENYELLSQYPELYAALDANNTMQENSAEIAKAVFGIKRALLVADLQNQADALNDKIEILKKEKEAAVASYKAITAGSTIAYSIAHEAYEDYVGDIDASIADLEAQIAAYLGLIDSYNSVDLDAYKVTVSGAGGATADAAEQASEAFQTAVEQIDQALELGEIDQEEYWTQYKALMDEYLTEGTEEWEDANYELLKGQKELDEDLIEEQQETYEDLQKIADDAYEEGEYTLEEYLKESARLRDKYLEEDSDEWEEAYQNTSDVVQEVLSNRLQDIKDEYNDALEDIQDDIDDMASRLASIDLVSSTTSSETGEAEYSFVDVEALKESNDEIQTLSDNLAALKLAGVSEGLLSEIAEMDTAEAIAYSEYLLGLSETEWTAYMEAWDTRQQLAADTAEQYYAEEKAALEENLVASVTDLTAEMTAAGYELGGETADSIVDGIVTGIKSGTLLVQSAISEMMSSGQEAADEENDAHSPSKKYEEKGEGIDEGAAIGIEKNKDRVQEAIQSLFSDADTQGVNLNIRNVQASIDQAMAELSAGVSSNVSVDSSATSLSSVASDETMKLANMMYTGIKALTSQQSSSSSSGPITIVMEQDGLSTAKGELPYTISELQRNNMIDSNGYVRIKMK